MYFSFIVFPVSLKTLKGRLYKRERVFKIAVVDGYMVKIFYTVILFSLIFIPHISVAKTMFTLLG